MKTLPLIKADMKKNLYVVWVALFIAYFMLYGRLYNKLNGGMYEIIHLTSGSGGYFGYWDNMDWLMDNAFYLSVWVILLVFVQFNRDYLNFKMSLPYKIKHLLLSKAVTAVVIAAIFALAYFVFAVSFFNEYRYATECFNWIGIYICNMNVALDSLTIFMMSIGLYAYIVFCNILFKRSFYGCVFSMAFLLTVFLNFIVLMENTNYNLSQLFIYPYYMKIIFIVLSAIAAAVFMPLSCHFYGKGCFIHPLFAFGAVEKVTAAVAMLFGGAFLYSVSEGKAVYYFVGAVIGFISFVVINTLVKRGWKK